MAVFAAKDHRQVALVPSEGQMSKVNTRVARSIPSPDSTDSGTTRSERRRIVLPATVKHETIAQLGPPAFASCRRLLVIIGPSLGLARPAVAVNLSGPHVAATSPEESRTTQRAQPRRIVNSRQATLCNTSPTFAHRLRWAPSRIFP
jgi:hypothetical protein